MTAKYIQITERSPFLDNSICWKVINKSLFCHNVIRRFLNQLSINPKSDYTIRFTAIGAIFEGMYNMQQMGLLVEMYWKLDYLIQIA